MSNEILIVLYGGRSAEREVSVMSATNVVKSVDYERFEVQTVFISASGDFYKGEKFLTAPSDKLLDNASDLIGREMAPSDLTGLGDVVLPVLHGPQGEDGSIQGFLEVLKMPYAGPGVLSAAATMDKLVSKEIFNSIGLPQVPYVGITDGAYDNAKLEEIAALGFPVFVKPANMGSSVGISKVDGLSDLTAALDEALKFDSRVIIEKGLVTPHEVECAALGNAGDVQVVGPGEVVNSGEFYTYDEKYINDALTIDVPAKLPEATLTQIRDYAKTAYQAVAGTGLSRCDFFVDRATGAIYLNEINAIPGFTAFSMWPMLWENAGLSVTEQISKLVDLAQAKFKEREAHLAQ
ncbi:MAG: D-alanine--D-alanine ligase [Streptococcaceae bacterium]|jgi:D-alanine-D-alanine ligase|nr:D-alanine--D-alanine ligase [Streptococcaceae bacterium]